MRNIKHTISAVVSVAMIASLAVAQADGFVSAKANRLNDNSETLYNEVQIEISDTEVSETDAAPVSEEPAVESEGAEGSENEASSEQAAPVDFYEDKEPLKNNTLEELKPYEPQTGYVITTTGGLNVRASASPDGEVLESLTYGQMIDIIEETDDWYVIPYGDEGGVGYVSKQFVTTSYEKAREVLLESVMYESGVVNVAESALNIRSAPSSEGTIVIDQVASGDNIVILDRIGDDWLKVYYGSNYGTGYVMAKYVAVGGMISRETVAEKRIERINAVSRDAVIVTSGSYVNVRSMPEENANVLKTYANGETCLMLNKVGDWTKIAYGPYRITGYVKSEYIMSKAAYDEQQAAKKKAAAAKSAKTKNTKASKAASAASKASESISTEVAPSSKGQAIVNEAAKYIGVKYVYGGTSPSGFDCSGLVQYACRKVGISVNRSSRAQYSNGVAVSKNNLQPGDLVFFSKGNGISHVGIYAGGGQVIHSPSPGKSVCYIALSKICSYSTYVGARRVY